MFAAKSFLTDNFRTPAELIARMRALRLPAPNEAAAVKWFSRDSVPIGWMARLLVVLEIEDGAPTSLAKYTRFDG